jgi:hypothetical protein
MDSDFGHGEPDGDEDLGDDMGDSGDDNIAEAYGNARNG